MTGGQSFLVGVKFLDAVNHCTVSNAVLKVPHEYNIEVHNVLSFVTDNAAYMHKAVREFLLPLYPGAIHMPFLSQNYEDINSVGCHLCVLYSNWT